MNVTFIGGSTGSGKSLRARQHVVANPGRYLLALPRIESIREFELDYIRALPDRKMVHAIYSDNKRRGNVKSQIEELPRLFKDAEHVVVMITHEGLMQADLSGFVGWHLIIDENVNAVLSGEIIAPQLSRMLHLIYALKPSPSTGWSDVCNTRRVHCIRDSCLCWLKSLGYLRQVHPRSTYDTREYRGLVVGCSQQNSHQMVCLLVNL